MTPVITQTVSIALSFLAGLVVGVFIRPYIIKEEKLEIQVKDLVAIVLMALLCVSVFAEIYSDYQVSTFLYGLVGAVVAAFYGPNIQANKSKDK